MRRAIGPSAHPRGRSTMANGSGTKADPWVLRTAPGSSEYTMYRDDAADLPALAGQVASRRLSDQAGAIEDVLVWLLERGDLIPLGAADESKPATGCTVEEFCRPADNPVGG